MLQACHKLQSKPKTITELKVHCSISMMTCHRQRSTKLSTTFANVWTRAFRPMVNILSIMMWTMWSRLIWHNFVKVADNWIKICSLAYIGTCNRCVKIDKKFPTVWEKCQKTSGSIFGSHCVLYMKFQNKTKVLQSIRNLHTGTGQHGQ